MAIGKTQPIEKKYTFSKDEKLDLTEIEVAISSFKRAVVGMQVNKDFVLLEVYKRLGIDQERAGYDRSIRFNLHTGEIFVTETPKKEEEKKTEIILPK